MLKRDLSRDSWLEGDRLASLDIKAASLKRFLVANPIAPMSDPFSIVKNASAHNILFNKIWLQGIVLRGVCYGVVFTLCCSCIHLLMSKQSRSSRLPQKKGLIIYVFYLLLLSTVFMVLGGLENQRAYISHAGYPGGPAAFALGDSSAIPIAQAVCFILLQWAADGLLVWRCFVFFAVMTSYTFLIRVFLGIMILLDIGLSIMFVICNTPLRIGSTVQQLRIILAYGIFTMLLNVGITAAIIMRILKHNRFVSPLLGQNYTGYYFGIISILVESAAVLAVHNIFFIVPAAIRHPLSVVGYHIGAMVQIIPPLMILQRVARGIAWGSDYNLGDRSGPKRSELVFAEETHRSNFDSLPASTTVV